MIIFSEASDGHENEDVAVVRPLLGHPGGWIGAIADGQGGRAGGAQAAQIACRTILDSACEMGGDLLARPGIWSDLFRLVDLAVTSDPQAGLCTLVSFAVFGGYVYGGSCGDSAAYLLNGAAQLSDLTERQQKNPQIGSGVTSCTFFSAPVVKPWSLLAMTDGVWKYAGREKIATLLKTATGPDLASKLEAAGRLPGSGKFPDDYSFALIEG